MSKTINVMFSCDDRIAKWIPTVQSSIYENNNYIIDIYLFENRVSEENKNAILDFASQNNQKAYIVHIDDLSEYEEMTLGSVGNWPAEAYFSLLAHKYLPDYVNRIIYFDVDVVVVGDISDFYFVDFQGAWLATANRSKIDKPILHDNIKEKKGFNSGSYVINIEKFRAENVTIDFYREIIKNQNGVKYFGDEALLTLAFGNKIIMCNSVYNFLCAIENSTPCENVKVAHLAGCSPWYWNAIYEDEHNTIVSNCGNTGITVALPPPRGYFSSLWLVHAEKAGLADSIRTKELYSRLIKEYYTTKNALEIKSIKLKIFETQFLMQSTKDLYINKLLNYTGDNELKYVVAHSIANRPCFAVSVLEKSTHIAVPFACRKHLRLFFPLIYNTQPNVKYKYEICIKGNHKANWAIFLSSPDNKTQHFHSERYGAFPITREMQTFCGEFECDGQYYALAISTGANPIQGNSLEISKIIIEEC